MNTIPGTKFNTIPTTKFNTIQSQCRRIEPTFPAVGMISVHNLAKMLEIKEDRLMKSLEDNCIPVLKLSDDSNGWLVNLKNLQR